MSRMFLPFLPKDFLTISEQLQHSNFCPILINFNAHIVVNQPENVNATTEKRYPPFAKAFGVNKTQAPQ